MKRVAVASSLFVAAMILPEAARANGRFPAAFQLVEDQADPAHLLVQVTYGLMSTRDAGASWGWTCEKAIGYLGEVDPPIAIAEGGVAFAALFDGITRSSPDGCDWAFVGGGPADRYAVDVSTRKGDLRDVVVLTSDGIDNNVFDTRLFRSSDAGASFARIDEGFPEAFVALTVDVAPTDAGRVYVTGLMALGEGDYEGILARSSDGGSSYELIPIEGTANDSAPYLAAVDPIDPDVLYVRLAGASGILLRSDDAGDTFQTIFEGGGALLGFALSPDGKLILVGGDAIPLEKATAESLIFEKVSDVLPRCLTWTDAGIYACGSETAEGFTIGISHDEGATFEKLYSRFCTEGPLECPPDTSIGASCDAEWIKTRPNIGADLCPRGDTTSTASSTGTAVTGGAGGGEHDDELPVGGCCSVAIGCHRADGRLAASLALLSAGVAWLLRRSFTRS